MTRVELPSRVGPDGVLNLHVPFGPEEANREVRITVEPAPAQPHPQIQAEDWTDFVKNTYGCCAGLGLEEPEDMPLQQTDWRP